MSGGKKNAPSPITGWRVVGVGRGNYSIMQENWKESYG